MTSRHKNYFDLKFIFKDLGHFSQWKDFGKKLLGEERGVACAIRNHFSGELWSMGEFSGFYSFQRTVLQVKMNHKGIPVALFL